MLYTFALTGNKKTGPIPITKTERASCPRSCALYNNGCYAENHHGGRHWLAMPVAATSINIIELCERIKRLPKGQLWRHNTAGDLPGVNEELDATQLDMIVAANRGKRGFTYTHKYNHADNIELIEAANKDGFTINLSANNAEEADALSDLTSCPVVVVLPTKATAKHYKTPEGRDIVTCPAAIHENITCATCGICADAKRSFIVGFPAHGTRKKRANEIACANI